MSRVAIFGGKEKLCNYSAICGNGNNVRHDNLTYPAFYVLKLENISQH